MSKKITNVSCYGLSSKFYPKMQGIIDEYNKSVDLKCKKGQTYNLERLKMYEQWGVKVDFEEL